MRCHEKIRRSRAATKQCSATLTFGRPLVALEDFHAHIKRRPVLPKHQGAVKLPRVDTFQVLDDFPLALGRVGNHDRDLVPLEDMRMNLAVTRV